MVILSTSTAAAVWLLFFLIITNTTTDAAATTNSTTHNSSINDTITASTFQELETTLQTLRNHGFTLFTNAIATSDIQMQLLSTNSTAADAYPFTIFAPRDVQLFTLDMESSAASYISTLRYHVIPNRRLTFSDLLNFTASFLDTLLPRHSVLIGKTQENGASGVVVDGVRVSRPDLFLGSRFAVHGIDGILVTGLIDHYFNADGEDSNLGPSPPPLSELDWSIPAEETLNPVSEYDRKHFPMTSPPNFDRNIRSPAQKKRVRRRGRKRRGQRMHGRHGRHHRVDRV